MFKSFLLELNISAVQTNYIFSVNSNDLNTIRLDLVIKDNAALVDLTGKIVRLAIRKPDHKVVFQSGGVTDGPGGKCEFILEKQAALVPGRHEAEVMIYQGDSEVTVTTKFYYEVKKAALSNEDVESSSDFPAISHAIAAGDFLQTIDLIAVTEAAGEVALAKEKADGTQFATVQERLNDSDEKLTETEVAINLGVGIIPENFPKLVGETDDTLRFKRAISALQNGDKFVVPRGSFTISEALNFKNLENITIEINGHIKVTKHGYCGIEIESCKQVDVSGVGKIEGYNVFPSRTFDGANREVSEKTRNGGGFAVNRKNGTSGTTAFGGGWEGNTGFGIVIYEGSENVNVSYLEVSGFNYGGVGIGWMGAISYNKNITVEKMKIHHCQDNGISGCKTYSARVKDNDVYDIGHPTASVNDTDINMGYGYTSLFTSSIVEDLIVSGNSFKRCARKGIDVHGAKNGVLIDGNTTTDCLVYGIATPHNSQATAWSEISIINNVVRRCGIAPNILTTIEYPHGIYFDATFGGILANNQVFDSGRHGIGVNVRNYAQAGNVALTIGDNFVSCSNANNVRAMSVEFANKNVTLTFNDNTAKTTVGDRGMAIIGQPIDVDGLGVIATITGNIGEAPVSGSSIGISLFQIADGYATGNIGIGQTPISANTTGKLKIDNYDAVKYSVSEFSNSWKNAAIAGDFDNAHYRKNRLNRVSLGGAINGGTVATNSTGVAFNLPAAYRPLKRRTFIVTGTDGTTYTTASVSILTNGDVRVNSAPTTTNAGSFVSLDGISFDLD